MLDFNKIIKIYKATANGEGLAVWRQKELKTKMLNYLADPNALPPEVERPSFWLIQKPVFVYAGLFSIFILLLSGGVVSASQSALPGEALYPVKRLVENVELKLSASEESRAEVHAKQASRRLNEIAQLRSQQEQAVVPEIKERVINSERQAEVETQDQLERALNILNDVSVKLESRGNVQAAATMQGIIEKLTKEASQVEFEVKVEGASGRIKVEMPRRDKNKDKSRQQDNNNKPDDENEQSGEVNGSSGGQRVEGRSDEINNGRAEDERESKQDESDDRELSD